MTSADTNVLLAALGRGHPSHAAARAFLDSVAERDDFALSEFVLVELYVLLRNPAVVSRPLAAPEAASVCQRLRRHPRWRLLGFPLDGRALHDTLWERAATAGAPRRRIYDLRLGISLLQQGVRSFATANLSDFADLGFESVWNPLAAS